MINDLNAVLCAFAHRVVFRPACSELPPSLVDYYFTRNTPLLYLSPQFWSRHNVTVRNVTVAEYCVAGTPLLAWVINMVASYDTVVINNLMYALHTDGTLVVSLISMPKYVYC